jgi:hypothetical protein
MKMKTNHKLSFRLFWPLLLLVVAGRLSAQELYIMPKGVQSRVSSFENLDGRKGEGGKTNKGAKGNAFESLKAGESKTLLDVRSAGIIQRMWFTIGDRTPKMLRSLRLRIYWDVATNRRLMYLSVTFFVPALGGLLPSSQRFLPILRAGVLIAISQCHLKKGQKWY